MNREQTTLRLPQALKEELMREAVERGQSFNDYLLSVIHQRDQARLSSRTQPRTAKQPA